jgi:hypothetical protein
MGMFPQSIQHRGLIGSLLSGLAGGMSPGSPALPPAQQQVVTTPTLPASPPQQQQGPAPPPALPNVIPGQGDPHKPGFDYKSVPFINTPLPGER